MGSREGLLVLVLLAVGSACRGGSGTGADLADDDADGFSAAVDCDDRDPRVHPGAEERCDGLDDDCDGVVEDYQVRFGDRDGDGWGDPDDERILCGEIPPGLADDNLDCDDHDPRVHPSADEPVCGGVDLNCDGLAADDGWALTSGVPWPTLQSALRAAPTTPTTPTSPAAEGREVLVCPGVHVGPFVVDGSITVRSLDGDPEATVLVGGASGPVVEVTPRSVLVLDGVTVTGGADRGLAVSWGGSASVRRSRIVGNVGDAGGGVWADWDSAVTLDSTEVSGNTASLGGGILLSGATLRLVDSVVEQNHADSGGGVYGFGAAVEIERSAVLGNAAVTGGGLWVDTSTVVLDPESRVAENEAEIAGGGVRLSDSTLAGGVVEDNGAYLGGGLYVYPPSHLPDLAGVTVRANTGTRGGGLAVGPHDDGDSNTFEVLGCAIEGNVAQEGGAFHLLQVRLSLDGATRVVGNVAEAGGGVHLDGPGSVVSLGAWWGRAGADANQPDDVRSEPYSYDAEGFATFDCDEEGGFTCE